jgi:hypothetical protein
MDGDALGEGPLVLVMGGVNSQLTKWNRIDTMPPMTIGFWMGFAWVIGAAGMIGCGEIHDVTLRDAGPKDAPQGQPDAEIGAPADARQGGPRDAAPDAPRDAPRAGIGYDVGYVNSITVNPANTGTFGFLSIVNTGTMPLDLSSTQVVASTDDSSRLDWTLTKRADSSRQLATERAAGFLTLLASQKVRAPGVITEPADDTTLDFRMSFGGDRASGMVVHAQAVLLIGGLFATLDFEITFDDKADTQPNTARRVSAGM